MSIALIWSYLRTLSIIFQSLRHCLLNNCKKIFLYNSIIIIAVIDINAFMTASHVDKHELHDTCCRSTYLKIIY